MSLENMLTEGNTPVTRNLRAQDILCSLPFSIRDAAQVSLPLVLFSAASQIVYTFSNNGSPPGMFIDICRLFSYSFDAGLAVYFGLSYIANKQRNKTKKIDFETEYEVKIQDFKEDRMTTEQRNEEIDALVKIINTYSLPEKVSMDEIAKRANSALTNYLTNRTGQRVLTSAKVLRSRIMEYIAPNAAASCDPLSGQILVRSDASENICLPFTVGHELAHRKGYLPEIWAQSLTYLAFVNSDDPLLQLSAYVERLQSNICVTTETWSQYEDKIRSCGLRNDIANELLNEPAPAKQNFLHHLIMPLSKLIEVTREKYLNKSGQNGDSDYTVGFTGFLHVAEEKGLLSSIYPTQTAYS